MIDTKIRKMVEFFSHAVAWLIILFSPLYITRDVVQNGFELNYFAFIFMYLVCFVVFYLDYLVFIPKLLFRSKTLLFVSVNLIVFVLGMYSVFYFHSNNRPQYHPKHNVERVERTISNTELDTLQHKERHKEQMARRHHPHFDHPGKPKRPDFWKLRLFHDGLLLLLVIAISILLRFTKRWFASIEERRELERSKMEVELKNLKNQLNPHFLFNTLNNIYALIGISQDKAQQAVFDLSKLLRYVLYEGETPYVPLDREVEFLLNYIKLMKLRLSSNVEVKTSFEYDNCGNCSIAQLIFISLVENAFKHGVSLTSSSFVDISLTVKENKQLDFVVKNSYFPKSETDKSGSGIGLENMKRRLDLLYPDAYVYQATVEDNVYTAILQIKID